MTPQEEQLLVQVIVQCVRAVLESSSRNGQQPVSTRDVAAPPYQESHNSRFINIAVEQPGGKQHGNVLNSSNGSRNEVREALQRFLRSSEPQVSNGSATQKSALQNGLPTSSNPAAQAQKRQLITQADILAAKQRGQTAIVLQPDAIVTPLARQVAKEKGIELR